MNFVSGSATSRAPRWHEITGEAGAAAISSSSSCLLLAALLKEVGRGVEGEERRGAGWHMLPPNKDYSKHLFTNSTLCLVCARERPSAYVVISERYSPQDSVLFTGIITVVERIASVQSDYNQHMAPGND